MALTEQEVLRIKNALVKAKETLPPEQFNELAAQVKAELEPDYNLAQEIGRAIVGPVLTSFLRPGQLVNKLLGSEDVGVDVKVPLLGQFTVEEPKDKKDVQKQLASSIKTVSLGMGPFAGGAAFGFGEGVEQTIDKDLEGGAAALETLKWTGIGAGTAAVGVAGSKALGKTIQLGVQGIKNPLMKGFSKLMNFTGEVPEEVIEAAFKNPKVVTAAQRSIKQKGVKTILENVQSSVKRLRSELTKSWDEGMKVLEAGYKGVGARFTKGEQKLLAKIADDHAIALPTNMEKVGIRRMMQLYQDVNEMFRYRDIREEAAGAVLRKVRSTLREKLTKSFGGADEGVDRFLKEYSNQKGIHDAVDSLFNAYKAAEPKKMAAAYRNLLNLFKEDKFSYAEALQDLEKALGKNLLDEIKALYLKDILPAKSGKFSVDEVFRLILLPITSPRLIGIEAKTLGGILNKANTLGEYISNLPFYAKKIPGVGAGAGAVGTISIKD